MHFFLLFSLLLTGSLLSADGKAAQNLLQNYDFETEGIWQSHCSGGCRSGRILRPDSPSGHCGFISKPDGKSLVAALCQNAPGKTGQTYLLSAEAKGKGRLFLYYYDSGDRYLGQHAGVYVNSMDWAHISCEVSPMGGTARVQIRFELYGANNTGEGWIDQIYWGPVPPAPPEVTGLTAAVDSRNQVTLTWDAPAGSNALSYEIYRSLYPDIPAQGNPPYAKTQDITWTDRNIPENWKHCSYRVCAVSRQHVVSSAAEPLTVIFPRRIPSSRPVIWTSSPMEKFRRYGRLPENPPGPKLFLQLARNEAEAGQILIGNQNRPIEKLDAAVSGFPPELKAELLRVHYTRITHATIQPDSNPPGLYADALSPWRKPISVPPFATQGIWLQLTSRPDCPPGFYRGIVTITADRKKLAEIPVRAEVWDFAVPATPSFQTAFAVWPDNICKGFGVSKDSPEFRKLHEKYYWFMTERRMPPDDLPVPLTSPEAARFLNDPRVNCFRIPTAGWGKVDIPKLKKLADYLRDKGWLQKGYVYCIDEPAPEQYPECRSLADQVHTAGRDIRFLLTVQPEEALKNAVNIWTPILHYVDLDICGRYRQAGDEIWWYTCINPQAPYPTYLIDDRGISHRVLSWLQARHQIDGVLYWCVNNCTRYRNSAYEDQVSVWQEAEMFPGANGDGFLTYPGKQIGIDGPVSSIRLELIRDGNEDAEYLMLLRRILKKKSCRDIEKEIDRLIRPVARTLTDWTKNPIVLERQRRAVAGCILRELRGSPIP